MSTKRFIRASGASRARTLLWAVGVSAALAGCGAPAEVAKSPDPVKVVWGSSDTVPEPEATSEPEATTPAEQRAGGPVEIDLDAPAAQEKKAQRGEIETEPEEEEEEEEAPSSDTAAVEEPRAPRPLEKEMRAAVKAKEKDSATPKKAVAKKSAPAAPAARTFSGPNPCKASSFSVTRVGNACATGGRSGAKGVMKDAISKALAAGTTLKCGDCHAEQRDYTLKANAVEQLEKWLDR